MTEDIKDFYQNILEDIFTKQSTIIVHIDGGDNFRGNLIEEYPTGWKMQKTHKGSGSGQQIEYFYFALRDVRGITVTS